MKDIIKKYYIYIIIGVLTVLSLILSFDYNKSDEIIIETPIYEQEVNNTFIYIDIGGSVLNPGVYKVERNTRLFQLIIKAGGLTKEANELLINQSMLLKDEMYVYIPNIYEDYKGTNIDNSTLLVNINSASKTELESLPGIGPSTAQSIIDYREQIKIFDDIEDLMNVPGIGETTFNELKDLITT